MPLFDRLSPIGFEAFCRNLHCCCGFRRGASITHQPKVPAKNRPNATENRPTSTQNRPDATFLCHFATVSRPFVQVANSDLRRIVCDFLTSRIRVGDGFSSLQPGFGYTFNDHSVAVREPNDHARRYETSLPPGSVAEETRCVPPSGSLRSGAAQVHELGAKAQRGEARQGHRNPVVAYQCVDDSRISSSSVH